MHARGLLIGGMVVVASGFAAGQKPPVFRASANYVEVTALVMDRDGHFVRGLTRDDFEVLEDGKRQDIATFSLVDLAAPAGSRSGAPLPPASDVSTNDPNGRIYLLVADLLNLAPDGLWKGEAAITYRSAFVRMRRAMRQFVQQDVSPGDLVGLVVLGSHWNHSGFEFTANKEQLLAVIDSLLGGGIDTSGGDQLSGPVGRNDDADVTIREMLSRLKSDECHEYVTGLRQAYRALGDAAQYLTGVLGRRKAIVLFSGGTGVDLHSAAPNRDANVEACGVETVHIVDDLVHAALRADVSIYSVDARGLSAVQASSAGASGQSVGWESLRVISDQTGGRAVLGFNDLSEPFRRIVQDSSGYYVLGYHAPSIEPNGKFHRITVHVRRPGLNVRARKGYYAPSKRDSKVVRTMVEAWEKTDVQNLLARSIPTGTLGLALRATAAPVKTASKGAMVAAVVEVGPGGLSFRREGDLFVDDIIVAHQALDADGASRAEGSQMVRVRVPPDVHDAVVALGWRFQTQIELPTGRYQLRLALKEQPTGHAGSVFVDVDVPDFAGPQLHMGAIVLSSSRADAIPSGGAVPALDGLLPGPAIAGRTFRSGESVAVFACVSENAPESAHTVQIVTTVRTSDDREVLRMGEPQRAADLRRAASGYVAIVPLAQLQPGEYVLKVTATSSLSRKTVSRQVPFRIERPES